MIDCQDFRASFDAFVAGTLSGRLLRDCEQHMTHCTHCLDLWAEHAIEQDITAHRSAVGGLVQITGSDSCTACEELLCDYTDGSLDEANLALASLHLETCESCQLTANALTSLRTDLPGLCDIEAPAELLDNILCKTQPWLSQPAMTGLIAVFSRSIYRPRFALEAAYVGTLVWVLAFGSAASPKDESPAYLAFQSLPVAVGESVTGIQQQITSIDQICRRMVRSGVRKTTDLSQQVFQGVNEKFRHIMQFDNARNQHE
jgi:hypothetical protein|tara:strand:+ start:3466 stop:4242 length:777 start_codon:yes stop_codon:yes gene_type:complete